MGDGVKVHILKSKPHAFGCCTHIKFLFKSKTIISSHTLVWTAGVTPVEIIKNSLFKTKNGQIIVNKFLELDDFAGVFAIGDCSQFNEVYNKRYPTTVQLAEAHAKLAA